MYIQLELPFDDCALINNILVLNQRRLPDDIIMGETNSWLGIALPWRRSWENYFTLNSKFIFRNLMK